MKVKITYTVDLEKVPEKADPLLEQVQKNVDQMVEIAASLKDSKDDAIEKCLRKIEELRLLFADTDIMIGDCETMLAGYLNLMTQQEMQEE